MRRILEIVQMIFLILIFLSNELAEGQIHPTSTQPTTAPRPVKKIKAENSYILNVLVINFDPILESRGKQKLHQFARWHDPRILAHDFIRAFRKATGAHVQYQLVQWNNLDEWPTRNDGFHYTDQTWLTDYERRPRVWPQDSLKWYEEKDQLNYKAILDRFDVEKLVQKNEVDQVWIFGYHYMGGIFFESRMAGTGAYWCNGPVIGGYNCKPFLVYYFNYERDIGCMLENVGHAMENIMKHVYKRCDYTLPLDEMNPWERFTLYDKIAPGHAACGNVHFAPNSQKDYDWGNTTKVHTTFLDWRNYPNLTGRTIKANCTAWGNGDMTKHHMWWFSLMPRVDGWDSFGVLNDWWAYYVQPTRQPE